ncbi:hypothetical protein, partial [Photobacterium carnosum]
LLAKFVLNIYLVLGVKISLRQLYKKCVIMREILLQPENKRELQLNILHWYNSKLYRSAI